ncbi:MAG: prolyl oligopeptidase family serine peptidase [Ruminococcus sp.]|nr:prolyl oligopeptidase family serine peptidase [Ruminococcus sp.]
MNEKNFYVNESGASIHCKIYCSDIKNLKRVVLYGHGFGGHKDNKAAERFAKKATAKRKDLGVVTFNLPCHGDDVRKTLVLSDCGEYITLVLNHIKTRFKVSEIYGYATSFGGYLFLKYISENGNPFKKLALRCPAIDMYSVITASIMTENDKKALLHNKPVSVGFDKKIKINKAFIDDLKAYDIRKYDYSDRCDDILIIHGTKDEVVPIESSKEFADNNFIDFIAVENADHRFVDPLLMDNAIRDIIVFFG